MTHINDEYLIYEPKLDDTMEEDLNLDKNKDNFYIVEKHKKKPGLDLEKGKYRIVGVVTSKSIYKRVEKKKKNETEIITKTGNVVFSFGYKVEEVATGKTKLVTKQQGIDLCRLYGMVNAFIITKKNEKKDSKGEVIKTKPSLYLQPYPSQLESFTKDDRVTTIFELDEYSKLVEPLTLTVKEEEATPEMWKLIQYEYAKMKEKLQKNTHISSKNEHQNLMSLLRAELRRTIIEEDEIDVKNITNN